MRLRIVLEPSEEGGYTAIAPSLPGCISEGETKEDALKNIREAIELYLEPVEDDQISSPEFRDGRIGGMTKVPSLPYDQIIRALQPIGH